MSTVAIDDAISDVSSLNPTTNTAAAVAAAAAANHGTSWASSSHTANLELPFLSLNTSGGSTAASCSSSASSSCPVNKRKKLSTQANSRGASVVSSFLGDDDSSCGSVGLECYTSYSVLTGCGVEAGWMGTGGGAGGGVGRFRRRGPLVRRTHSPKTVPSPLSSPRCSPIASPRNKRILCTTNGTSRTLTTLSLSPTPLSPASHSSASSSPPPPRGLSSTVVTAALPYLTAATIAAMPTLFHVTSSSTREKSGGKYRTKRNGNVAASPVVSSSQSTLECTESHGHGDGAVTDLSPISASSLSCSGAHSMDTNQSKEQVEVPPLPCVTLTPKSMLLQKKQARKRSRKTLIKMRLVSPTTRGISEAVRVLAKAPSSALSLSSPTSKPSVEGSSSRHHSGIVAFPTETIYVMGCHVRNAPALQKLMEMKDRSSLETSSFVVPQHGSGNGSLAVPKDYDVPMLFVSSMKDAKQYVGFNPSRPYTLMQPSNSTSTTKPMEMSQEKDDGEAGKELLTKRPSTDSEGSCVGVAARAVSHDFTEGTQCYSTALNSATRSDSTNQAAREASKESTLTLTRPVKSRSETVCLSEGWLVFRRLASTFWPGPLVIVVPAKQHTSEKSLSEGGDGKGPNGRKDKLGSGRNENGNESTCVPVLPKSTLLRLTKPIVSSGVDRNGKARFEDVMHVALRCPSHPLSQKLLKEAGVPIVGFAASSPSSKQLDGESSAPSPKASTVAHKFPTKAKEVQRCWNGRTMIFKPEDGNNAGGRSQTETHDVNLYNNKAKGHIADQVLSAYCINGEDKRELFTVPTCARKSPSTMILIDEATRTVKVLRQGEDVSLQDLQTALREMKLRRNASSLDGGADDSRSKRRDIRCRIVRGLLWKWKVVSETETVFGDEGQGTTIDREPSSSTDFGSGPTKRPAPHADCGERKKKKIVREFTKNANE